MDKFSFLNTAHTAYFADLYDQYLQNPDAVEPSWRAFFQGYDFGSENYGMDGEIVEGVSTQIPEQVQKEFQVVKLIDSYRTRGHLFTQTNPVRARRKYAPTLEIENFGLSQNDLDTVFNAGDILGIRQSPGRTTWCTGFPVAALSHPVGVRLSIASYKTRCPG